MPDVITYAREGDVALIGLNRPAKRNAMNDETILAIEAAVRRAGDEAEVGLIFGHGLHFSAGLDLAEHADRSPVEGMYASMLWHKVFEQIDRGRIPFVSALQGAVIGGGLELAASTHIRVADETAFFALPEGQRGIFVGGGGSVRVQRIIGYPTMADMMLTGRLYSAREAVEIRLAQYVVPPGEAVAKAVGLAQRI